MLASTCLYSVYAWFESLHTSSMGRIFDLSMVQKRHPITGSAVAPHSCKAHSKIDRKMESSTPCKIVTPENFILKRGTRDYVEDVTYYTIFSWRSLQWELVPK